MTTEAPDTAIEAEYVSSQSLQLGCPFDYKSKDVVEEYLRSRHDVVHVDQHLLNIADSVSPLSPDLFDGSDSSLGDDAVSSRYTASLTSSIERYPIENGRRYHAYKDGSYVMPNDESELDRLDLTHNLLKITMGTKLFNAPIDKPKRILDIGTGTGIWAIEMADEYPEAEITGTDLSATQPTW